MKVFMQNKKRIINSANAIKEATQQMLDKDKNLVIMGEGVCDPKAIFNTTKDLQKKFGRSRVIETPISENGLTGITIGLSINKIKVILIHQRVEFALLSLEQIFNNAAKTFFVSNGIHNIPIVIRMVIGRGWGQGPAHSQSLETIFSYIPGLKVIMPGTAKDAKGMLISAIEDPNPVLILEHRWFHYVTGDVPKKIFKTNIDSPSIIKKGIHVTIVSSSYGLYECIFASKILSNFNINLEIIDLRVFRPLNITPIYKSLKKTKKLIIFEIGFKILGIGSEIITSLFEKDINVLDKPPIRLGLPDLPTPSSRSLAKNYYPTAKNIINAVISLLQLNVEVEKKIINFFNIKAPKHQIDVPNPDFKGPF
tara:strand:+ start:277 stop:1374 length:1098 start_codon:yes stop_codon:yes gene_type:complete